MKLEEQSKTILEGKSVIVYNNDTLNNPADPMVQVSLHGVMRLSQLQKMVDTDIKQLSKWSNNPSALLKKISLIQQYAEALNDIQLEMKSPQFKRKIK